MNPCPLPEGIRMGRILGDLTEMARWAHPSVSPYTERFPRIPLTWTCKTVIGWKPVLIKAVKIEMLGYEKSFPIYIQEIFSKNLKGLILAYPKRAHATPFNIRFIIHPSLIEGEVREKLTALFKNGIAIVRVRECEAFTSKYYRTPEKTAEIWILPPKEQPELVNHKLIIFTCSGKSTGSGAYADCYLKEEPKAIWTWKSESSSNSGRHWQKVIAILAKINEPVKFHYGYVSSNGGISVSNDYEY